MNELYGVSELEFVCRSCETDAVRRLAARRLSRRPKCHAIAWKSVETMSRPTFRQLHGTLGVATESPSSRSTVSVAVSQPQQTHERSVTPYNAFAAVP